MATDYNKIGENPRINFRKIFTPYSDKTHFVYELIQNADDNESECIELQLYENELIVWNDGDEFLEEDVHSICSIGFSNKDLTQIGTFGMGFKAVYAYTDSPEVYSGDERFRISISNPTQPEGIDGDIDVRVSELLKEGKRLKKNRTIFRLPFRRELRQEEEIARLKDRLCNLEKLALLFLRNLKTVRWYDKNNGQEGSYSCHRPPHDKIQNASVVELKASINGINQPSEIFLVFRKEVQPPQTVINELLQQSEDSDERQRIQKSAKKLQSVEVAFKFQDDRITAMNNCVLFSYFPTQKETHLQFFIQASYKTTLARDNIDEDNRWNEWLIRETANFLPEVLKELKEAELLKPAFFNVVPLEEDNVPGEFSPIAEAMQKAMQEDPFIPTQNDVYAKARTVFYPHRESLPGLVESGWLRLNNSWLHPEIRDTEEFRRCFKVMREAGVREVGVSQVLDWLEKRSFNWFEGRCEQWLRSMYVYLNSQKSELERIKKLSLVRLENGEHVCANEQSVFFPPGADEEREEIKPFLNDLPILQSTLLEGEERHEIEVFLKSMGIKVLRRVDMILEGICPQYSVSAKPSPKENLLHVRYIFKVWNDVSDSERSRLKVKISEIPILRAYKGIQHEAENKNQNSVAKFHYVKPCDAYLPQAYTGDDDLETYFSVYDGEIWFVDDAYLENNSDAKVWRHFLKVFGVMNTPRITLKSSSAEEWDLLFQREVLRTGEDTCEQPEFEGMFYLLWNESTVSFSKSLWNLLVKSLPSEKKKWDSFFQGTYRWHYYRPRSKPFNSFFFIILMREGKWLPDEQNNFDDPSKCFARTPENRRLLADSVSYLHPDFNIRTEPAQWLAEKLEIRLKPDTESVLNYLRKLSSSKDASFEKVEPLYHFLRWEGVDAQLIQKFKKETLIFTSSPEPRWWRSDKVFWKNESEVFKNDRGYLKAHYPETLKSFFIALGVSEQASQQDYALGIQEITTTKLAEDEEVRERVQRFYKCLRAWSVDKLEIYDSRCWLGKKGEEWEFFTRQELVLKDHPHIGEIFEGKVPFWTFDNDLSSLASRLGVERCSQAKFEFHPEGKQEEDTDWSEKVRNLRPYIYAFLNSPRLSEESDIFIDEEPKEEKLAKVLDQLSVCRVKELKVTYKLKEISVIDPNPRPSFLDVTGQRVILWLGQEVNESEYAELIGDALQDRFGAKELGRFIEDLLTPTKKQDRVLSNWKRKGLETKFLDEDPEDNEKKQIESLDEKLPDEPTTDESDMRIPTDNETPKTDGEDNDSLTADESETYFSRSEDDDSRTDGAGIETLVNSETSEMDESDDDSPSDESKNYANLASDVKDISSPDTQSSTKTGSGITQNVNGESKSETPTVHENPKTGNENDDSTGNESKTPTYQPLPGRSGTTQPGGHSISTSTNRKRGGGGHGGHGGGGEGEEHENLKRDLANNPSQFGEGLELVKIEYTFGSGDRVDILLKDGSENPVTVEVETGFSSGSGRYVGVWQAVKYQHLAAMKYNLVCKQVRSILAAPEIPDDVKEKCKELGIEPFEVPQE